MPFLPLLDATDNMKALQSNAEKWGLVFLSRIVRCPIFKLIFLSNLSHASAPKISKFLKISASKVA